MSAATPSITSRYQRAFGNLDEVYPPAVWDHPEFLALAERALARGYPLTLPEVQQVLPQARFEEAE